MPFTGVLEPLSPATQYICKVSVYNIDGWSASKAGSLLTTPDCKLSGWDGYPNS